VPIVNNIDMGPTLFRVPDQPGAPLQNNTATGIPAPIFSPLRLAVPYVELEGSPRFHVRPNGSEVVREYRVPWDDPLGKGDAWKDLLGFPQIIQAQGQFGPVEVLSRYLPDSFPFDSAGNSGFTPPQRFLWCTEVRDTKGMEPASVIRKDNWGVMRYGAAQITAVYSTLSYKILSDLDSTVVNADETDPLCGFPDESLLTRYVTIQPNPTSKIQTLPQNSLIFATSGSVQGTNGRLELEADLEITWHQVPRYAVGLRLINPYIAQTVQGQPYTPSIEACLGTINLYPFAGCKKGTMLLSAAIIKPYVSMIGDDIVDVSYRFKWFPARSTLTYPTSADVNNYVYGHVLLIRPDLTLFVPPGGKVIGYDEAVVFNSPRVSNYILAQPLDGINIYNFRDFRPLFRVPYMARDNP